MKTLAGVDQLQYIDAEGKRVVTNNRCVAEQIKNDKVENVATGESKIGEFGKVGKRQKLKSIVKDGVTIEQVGKVGKSENSKTQKERKDHNEEKLCRSIKKGLARRNREKHAILAEIEEEQPVICIDDVTRTELSGQQVRKAREQELKFSRDLGVCVRKSMNVKPLHNTSSLQPTRSGLIQKKHWGAQASQITSIL